MTFLASDFAALRTQVAADYVNYVTRVLGGIFTRHDDASLRRLGNEWGQDGAMWRELRRFVAKDRTVKHDELAMFAAIYADQQVNSMVAKLEEKLVGCTDVSVPRFDGDTFVVRARKGAHSVTLDQSRIINVSPKGKLFHQWPARIYVDGKFTSAAAFKKL
jgi:hypothetical protein